MPTTAGALSEYNRAQRRALSSTLRAMDTAEGDLREGAGEAWSKDREAAPWSCRRSDSGGSVLSR